MQIVIFILIFASIAILGWVGVEIFGKGFRQYEEKYLSRASQDLDEMFVFLSPEQVWYSNFVSAVGFLILGFIFTGNIVISLALAAGGFFLPRLVIFMLKKRRLNAFNVQLLEAMQMLSSSLRAGLTLDQAIERVGAQFSPPLSQEFALVVKECSFGLPLEKALENLKQRMRSEDLELMVLTSIIAINMGADLAYMYDRISETIRERNTMQGKIKSLTSEGRMQGVVLGLLPWGLALIMYLMQPSMIERLFNDPVGWVILSLAILFEGVGVYLIWKIVSIEI